jgi:hypothetical protein
VDLPHIAQVIARRSGVQYHGGSSQSLAQSARLEFSETATPGGRTGCGNDSGMDQIHRVFPPYAPEFNPIERVWGEEWIAVNLSRMCHEDQSPLFQFSNSYGFKRASAGANQLDSHASHRPCQICNEACLDMHTYSHPHPNARNRFSSAW